jgi:hypothetical protein
MPAAFISAAGFVFFLAANAATSRQELTARRAKLRRAWQHMQRGDLALILLLEARRFRWRSPLARLIRHG